MTPDFPIFGAKGDAMLKPPAIPRQRQRDYWQRQRDGVGIAPAPYTAELIAFLIETHWLAERDAGDRCAIGCAIARAVTRN
jgi:hypothetical protein